MEIKLKLYNHTGIFDTKKIIFAKNEVVSVRLDKILQGCKYYANVDNENFEIKNGVFTLENLKGGLINIVVYATINGEIVKKWYCEQLIVCDLGGENSLIGEIAEFKEVYNEKLNEVISKQSEIIKKLTDLEQRICDLENNFDPTV